MTNNKLFFGFVDISGESVTKTFEGMFDSVDDSIVSINLHIGKKIITNEEQFEQYKPFPFIGEIKENINGEDYPVSNVKVTFIQDYIVNGTRENVQTSNLNYTGFKRIADVCTTDENGEYVAFIENGTYTIKIEGGKYNQTFHHQQISNGLNNEYYFTIKSLIKNRYKNTLVFSGTDKRLIKGTMLDQNKKPINNAEIIISQGKDVVVYHKTDKFGNYNFCLPLGVYNVRIRGPKHSVKIAKNISFEEGNDFMETLNNSSNIFRRGEWLWIYN